MYFKMQLTDGSIPIAFAISAYLSSHGSMPNIGLLLKNYCISYNLQQDVNLEYFEGYFSYTCMN